MSPAAKIATCSYCGTKVVISLTGKGRYELICTSCSAPLKNTKLLYRNPPPTATAQTLFDVPLKRQPEVKADHNRSGKSNQSEKERDNKDYKKNIKRRDSEEYKTDRKSRDSEDRKWSKEDDDLKKKYKERKYQKRKKPTKKRRGLFYWIREAADEIDDLFD